MNFTRALVRPPAKTFAKGLTSASLGTPDLGLALRQHSRYVEALRSEGVEVTELAPNDAHPDSTFVEDCAVVAGDALVWTRPGASARAAEVQCLRDALLLDHPTLLPSKTFSISSPGTVDGGDVCRIGDSFLIGISQRTNEQGAHQLAEVLEILGFEADVVDISLHSSLLHLKSGLSALGSGRAVAVEVLAKHPSLAGLQVHVPPSGEEYAANCVAVTDDTVLFPSGHPKLARELKAAGIHVVELDASEFRKMDGGLSCLSLRF